MSKRFLKNLKKMVLKLNLTASTKKKACYADRYHQAVINYDGSVFKCTARDFAKTNERDGILMNDGRIDWDEKKFNKRLGKTTIENKYCNNCKYLPLCFGPCSQKQLELTDMKDFKTICYKGGMKTGLNRLYRDFYDETFISNWTTVIFWSGNSNNYCI